MPQTAAEPLDANQIARFLRVLHNKENEMPTRRTKGFVVLVDGAAALDQLTDVCLKRPGYNTCATVRINEPLRSEDGTPAGIMPTLLNALLVWSRSKDSPGVQPRGGPEIIDVIRKEFKGWQEDQTLDLGALAAGGRPFALTDEGDVGRQLVVSFLERVSAVLRVGQRLLILADPDVAKDATGVAGYWGALRELLPERMGVIVAGIGDLVGETADPALLDLRSGATRDEEEQQPIGQREGTPSDAGSGPLLKSDLLVVELAVTLEPANLRVDAMALRSEMQVAALLGGERLESYGEAHSVTPPPPGPFVSRLAEIPGATAHVAFVLMDEQRWRQELVASVRLCHEDPQIRSLALHLGEGDRVALPVGTTTASQLTAELESLIEEIADVLKTSSEAPLSQLVLSVPSERHAKPIREGAALLVEQFEALLSAPIAPSRPTFDSDQVRIGDPDADLLERDSLDIEKQVRRFARLICAGDVPLPMAIGLFGDWGVGKSYFMGSLHQAIRERNDRRAEGDVGKIAQIEFNAWHYVDTNLWANLATRIFDGLAYTLAASGAAGTDYRQALRSSVASSQDLKQRAETRLRDAEEQRREATQSLALLEEEKRKRLDQTWSEHLEDAKGRRLKQKLEQAVRWAKLAGVETTIDASQLLDVRDRIQAISRRGQVLGRVIGIQLGGWHLAALVAAAIVLVLAFDEAQNLGTRVPALESMLEKLQSVWVKFGSVVSAGSLWIGSRVHRVTTAFDTLSNATREIEVLASRDADKPAVEDGETTDEASEPGGEAAETTGDAGERTGGEERAADSLAAFDAQIESERQAVAVADLRIAQARAELQRIDAGGLLYDFLSERSADRRYLRELGIISIVRRDLEDLGQLLKDLGGEDPIERIVLYIDDLDRCRPQRVVEVLEAVHLLLAFDLFVVVVGVDARWLERALNESYSPTRGQKGRSQHRFSAHNYLEKIFQIPFSLEPMGADGYAKLVDSLVTTRTETTVGLGAGTGVGERPPEPQTPPNGTQTSPTAEPAPPPGTTGEATQPGDPALVESEPVSPPVAPLPEPDTPEREVLCFEDWEETFIQALHPFIKTPRLTTRFVNIYRLLRVEAAEGHFADFVAPGHGYYQTVLLCLAIAVGHPRVGGELLRLLANDERPEWGGTLDEFLLAAEKNATGEAAAQIGRIRAGIAAAAAALYGKAQERMHVDLAVARRWAPRVGRYSFRWSLDEGKGAPAVSRIHPG